MIESPCGRCPAPAILRAMRQTRRRTRLAAAAALSSAALVGGGVAWAGVDPPRDEAGFLTYARQYVGGHAESDDPGSGARDTAWVRAHPAEAVAEGDRACAWLAARADAPEVDPTGRTSTGVTSARYLRRTSQLSGLTEHGRSYLVAGAWEHLCKGDRRDKTSRISDERD